MRKKPRWYSILVVGLVLLLAASVVLTSGCEQKTEVESPAVGPLESPFGEIIPTREDITNFYNGLEVAPGHERPEIDVAVVEEYTWSSSEGDVTYHHRVCVVEAEKLKTDMYIAIYPNETEANEYFQNRVEGYKSVASAPCRDRFEFAPDDALGYTYETDRWANHGPSEEDWLVDGIIFRVGHYVAHYEFTLHDPPINIPGPTSLSASGIYYLPLHLYMMLNWPVETTIPKLRSI